MCTQMWLKYIHTHPKHRAAYFAGYPVNIHPCTFFLIQLWFCSSVFSAMFLRSLTPYLDRVGPYIDLNQWLSNFSLHHTHLEHLLKCRMLGSKTGFWWRRLERGLKICIFNNAVAAYCLGTTLWKTTKPQWEVISHLLEWLLSRRLRNNKCW